MDKKGRIALIGALVLMVILSLVLVAAAKPLTRAAKQCNNGFDDDGDGLTDYPADPGCSSRRDNTETSPSLVCDNGADEANDADTKADYRLSGGDPGCTSPTDPSEVDGQCDDLSDNDGDAHTDVSDSKCTGYSDNDESPRDFCNDSDGGIVPGIVGTASGDDASIWFNQTDFCLDATNVREYYCGGFGYDYDWFSTDLNCVTNSTTMCSAGACV